MCANPAGRQQTNQHAEKANTVSDVRMNADSLVTVIHIPVFKTWASLNGIRTRIMIQYNV